MSTFDPHDYGRGFAQLLNTNRCRPLGAGRPADEMRGPLRDLSIESAFDHTAVVDPDMARCCIAGIWLLYDFLDESHQFSQAVQSASGSYWHAVMHRREGDFSNAKYWFRRVGDHPIFERLSAQAVEIAADDPPTDDVDRIATGGPWDPDSFVDLCQRVSAGLPDIRQECELIQQAEWELLFDHCYRAAIR